MYIKEENGKVIIYQIKISEDLQKIRDELIEKYSSKTELTKETTDPYILNNYEYKTEKIILTNRRFTGKYREYNDFYSSPKKIYEYRYIKYEYPDIVIYINELLDMNFESLPKLRKLISPRKIYRLNDKNREFIKNLLPYKDYIKRILACIKIENIKEGKITSLSSLLDLLSDIEDENIKIIYDNIQKKISEGSKKLSYLMEEKND